MNKLLLAAAISLSCSPVLAQSASPSPSPSGAGYVDQYDRSQTTVTTTVVKDIDPVVERPVEEITVLPDTGGEPLLYVLCGLTIVGVALTLRKTVLN